MPRIPKKATNSSLKLVQSRAMPAWARGRNRSYGRQSARSSRFAAIPGIAAALVMLGGAAYLAAKLDPLPPRFVGIAQAADGDSLRLRGDRIRLKGLDAPELDQVCWDPAGKEWACGRAARARLEELLAQGPADCQPLGNDKYGRTLATCSVAGSDVGAILVAEGLAVAYGGYEAEEAAARSADLGIWRGRFVDPGQWREQGPVAGAEPSLLELVWNWFRELTGATTLR